MQTLSTINAVRAALTQWRAKDEHIAFVPTMGNLHRGHLALVEKARQIADRVVVSIFVNPMQFSGNEDFSSYPRTLQDDMMLLTEQGVDLLFTPSVDDIYPRSAQTTTQVIVPQLSEILCGATRQGHFTGVSTVVMKLFNIVQPHVALFGEKDYQQLLVIRRLVDDLFLPIRVVGLPTQREADGLALSSRNGYLTADERQVAPQLYQALQTIKNALLAGERDLGLLTQQAMAALAGQCFQPEYIEVRRPQDLAIPAPADNELLILAAARLGKARLIDNLCVSLVGESGL